MLAAPRACLVLLAAVLGPGCGLETAGLFRDRADGGGIDAAVRDAGTRDGGSWDASTPDCDGAASCGCVPGMMRTASCPMCGYQAQRCAADGTWMDEGACTGAGECMADGVETGPACAMCGAMLRTCSASCTWNAWSCVGARGTCMVGAVDVETRPCACGGTETRVRSCDATCAWGAWDSWGTCTTAVTPECVPGSMESDTQPCGTTGCGTATRTRTCDTGACTWEPWTAFDACAGDTGCWSMSAGVWRCIGYRGTSYSCCRDSMWHMVCP